MKISVSKEFIKFYNSQPFEARKEDPFLIHFFKFLRTQALFYLKWNSYFATKFQLSFKVVVLTIIFTDEIVMFAIHTFYHFLREILFQPIQIDADFILR